jgi:recombinational DNA repair ATPase RecF
MTAPSDAARSVEDLLYAELDDAQLEDAVSDLLLGAIAGDAELASVVAGEMTAPAIDRSDADGPAPVKTYLKTISVSGFRGIGDEAALRLQPGPGLTVVTGRNGSGKSSFAEAAELALTGDSKRWSGRTAVWREGWRNLHATDPTRVVVELSVDGQPGVTRVSHEWTPDADLEAATATVQRSGAKVEPLTALGWAQPLELYRPFLSYAELGALVDGRPSDMYDALQAILGLDTLLDAERRLNELRKQLDTTSKTAKQHLPPLLSLLDTHPDPRASQARNLLSARRPDLDAVETLAVGDTDSDATSAVGLLRQLASLSAPDPDVLAGAAEHVAAAHQRCVALAATDSAQARRLANLLTEALAHHEQHPGELCPVCGGQPLDEQWAVATRTEVEQLTARAAEADAADRARDAAAASLSRLAPPVPAVLSGGDVHGVDTSAARQAWTAWVELVGTDDLDRLRGDAAPAADQLATQVRGLAAAASAELERRAAAWQPVARQLAAWVDTARTAEAASARLTQVKAAVEWLRAVGQRIRDQRLEPFATMSSQIWESLRQESNVELGPIRLEGAATRRRVALDVTVDGVAGAALSVMSQGELHALGLSLFLPRATTPDSPFRFLLIDDPVQAMDPAKVYGLAQVLSDIAQTRQVIVFTHDDRLAEAVRRLELPATVWEVVRREGSVVELKKNDDPVTRYLTDARALAKADELSADVRAVVVAGFCRSALEAACHAAVRARMLHSGTPHHDVEEALRSAHTIHQLMALTLLGDTGRGDEVTTRLRNFGAWASEAFRACKSGVHDPYGGDLMTLVRDTERLATKVQTG